MSDPRPIAEEELHAFVDNQLDEERRPAVLRYLQEHPDVARQVEAYAAQREALRQGLAPLAAEPIPPALDVQRLVQERLSQRHTQRHASWRIAAGIALAFIVGGATGWFGHGQMQPGDMTMLAQQAAANHAVYSADRRRPTELGAEQREDLARWVSNRLNHRVAPPDLEQAGYHYMGGRLAATPDGPGGLFMYDNAQGVRLTVFVLPMSDAADTPMRQMHVDAMDGFAWIDKSVGYAVVGKLPSDELHGVAQQVKQQFARTT